MGPYAVDEFMIILEGSLCLGLLNGSEITINAGDAFVIPKGFVCQWKQYSYVQKFFMILDEKVQERVSNISLTKITVPKLHEQTSFSSAVDILRTDFINSSGNLKVGLRICSETVFTNLPILENHLFHVLEGNLQLSEGETNFDFQKGETAYIMQGGTLKWQTDASTRLLQSSYFCPFIT